MNNRPYYWPGCGNPAEHEEDIGIRNTSDATKVGLISVSNNRLTGTRVAQSLPRQGGQLMNRASMGLTAGRTGLFERFDKTPQLSAVTQLPAGNTYNTADFLASIAANRYFEVLGVNAVSADVTEYAEGGIAVATHGASSDSTIILPHLTSNQSPWTRWTWGTDQQVRWTCGFQTPASVATLKIWAGLKKTNTPVVTTDTDQVFFKYDSAVSTDPTLWHTIYSINDTDTEAGVGSAVAAATNYTLMIDIDSNRVARFYLNGTLVTTSTALTNAVDLKPYFGILSTSAAARTAYLFFESITRKTGA